MENKETPPVIDYFNFFKELPFGWHMKLPMDLLTPIIADDYKKPETEGPIQVFQKDNKIYIDDGNHRYYDQKRELFFKNDYKQPDLSKSFMDVVKIDPKKAINNWMLKY